MTISTHSEEQLKALNDDELVEVIGNQESRDALRVLYDRYRYSLGGFLRKKINQEQLVDELYNDVMLTVWRKASDFRGESKASTWIFGIAYRLCMSEIRKSKRQPISSSEFELDEMPDTKTETTSSPEADRLNAAINDLSEDHQEVIQLVYFYGHSLSDISSMIDCPLNTVKTRLFHARQKLKSLIEKSNEPTQVTI